MEFIETPHYYGDIVRKLFIAAGAVLLIAIIIDKQLLPFNITFGIIGLIIIAGLAGFTNPKSKISVIVDTVFAAVMFAIFEFFAIAAYSQFNSYTNSVFLVRQITALLFIVAFYFSIKSLRGMLIK